jgi:uncharacterized membrane protein YecN with MAPEG domain
MNEFTTEYHDVIWVTLAYIGVYYAIITNGLRVKMKLVRECKAEGKPFLRYSNTYPELLASDRHQLNTLEHMPPFLVLLWLQAFVVSVESAMVLGWIYVLLRATYPFFVGSRLRSGIKARVFINTWAGYTVLTIFAVWQMMTLLG